MAMPSIAEQAEVQARARNWPYTTNHEVVKLLIAIDQEVRRSESMGELLRRIARLFPE